MYLYIESRIVVTLCTFWFYIKKNTRDKYKICYGPKGRSFESKEGFPLQSWHTLFEGFNIMDPI
jgi:hypothetical protein